MFLLNHLVTGLEGIDDGAPAFLNDAGEHISFAIFARRVRCLAGGLSELLATQGRVGILALNSRNYVEVLLAAAWSGRVAVPLNVRWSDQELAEAILDAQVEVLFVDPELYPRANAVQQLAPVLGKVVLMEDAPHGSDELSYAALLEHPPLSMAMTDEDTLTTIIYTGGTTGRAKGAMHTQGSLLASALNFVRGGAIPHNARTLISLPLFHSGAIGIVFAQLLQRNSTVLLPQFRPELVCQCVSSLGIDALVFVPTMLGMLLDSEGFSVDQFAGVQALVYGASPMPSGLLHRVLESFPRAQLTQVYGMTEVGLAVMLSDRWHRGNGAKIAAAGQPGPLYQVRVEDEAGCEVPRGHAGQVVFSGPGVMRGYFNQPAETEAVMRDGGLLSGDVGVMDEHGVLTLLDRAKDMIVTGGENVYSVEVENVVSRHPAVAQCSVIGVPDPLYGERVHAVIVPRPEVHPPLDLETLRAYCARFIAGYKCPRSMDVRDSLPLSPMGKILKNDLRKEYWLESTRQVN